mmetsp:Transcript_81924/g.236918  ORF Transcript_81924/g.236918 Transcript_81924/m.236918 type:complete len:282 (+) Transcript_81924:900-1745(+)
MCCAGLRLGAQGHRGGGRRRADACDARVVRRRRLQVGLAGADRHQGARAAHPGPARVSRRGGHGAGQGRHRGEVHPADAHPVAEGRFRDHDRGDLRPSVADNEDGFGGKHDRARQCRREAARVVHFRPAGSRQGHHRKDVVGQRLRQRHHLPDREPQHALRRRRCERRRQVQRKVRLRRVLAPARGDVPFHLVGPRHALSALQGGVAPTFPEDHLGPPRPAGREEGMPLSRRDRRGHCRLCSVHASVVRRVRARGSQEQRLFWDVGPARSSALFGARRPAA